MESEHRAIGRGTDEAMMKRAQPETEGTRGNSAFHKKGVEEPARTEQPPPCACAMANCVYTAGGQWAVKREGEGGSGKRGKKQAGQDLLGGKQVGRDARPPTQQKQQVPPVPPPRGGHLNWRPCCPSWETWKRRQQTKRGQGDK
jgi:hypothetical protein